MTEDEILRACVTALYGPLTEEQFLALAKCQNVYKRQHVPGVRCVCGLTARSEGEVVAAVTDLFEGAPS